MQKILEDQVLSKALTLHDSYQNASPFPHIVIDHFVLPEILQAVVNIFPQPHELNFYRYENALEKKLAFDQINYLPEPIAQVLHTMNSPIFLHFLEELTGINGLIPDPYYRGGGIHQILPGGKLDIHIDFNRYTKLNLYRRLNAILYLNQDWDESYSGHLELWRGHKVGNQHVLIECIQRILPIFNRLVIFSTSECSYHGHPNPLTCPKNRSRKSLATYYYTAIPSSASDEMIEAHSTTFVKRPTDPHDPELERLRDKRNQGRLTSNVKSKWVAE